MQCLCEDMDGQTLHAPPSAAAPARARASATTLLAAFFGTANTMTARHTGFNDAGTTEVCFRLPSTRTRGSASSPAVHRGKWGGEQGSHQGDLQYGGVDGSSKDAEEMRRAKQ